MGKNKGGMKVYAVRQGRNPGIYQTWPQAQEQVEVSRGRLQVVSITA
jgi:viroplasmin and RNaseH domain-containing protein